MTRAARRNSSPFFMSALTLVLATAPLLFSACSMVRVAQQVPAPPPPAPESDASPSSGYHYSLAVLQNLSGQTDGAIRQMERAIERDPKSAFLKTELAALYMDKGDSRKAIALCEEALAEEPNAIDVHLLLGNVYLTIKDYQSAAKVFRKTI